MPHTDSVGSTGMAGDPQHGNLGELWEHDKQQFLDACTLCGACMEVCPILEYTDFAGMDPATAAEHYAEFLQSGDHAKAVNSLMRACTRCGLCGAACDFPELHLETKDFVYVELNRTDHPLRRFETELIENHENVFRIFSALQPKPRNHYERWVGSLPLDNEQVDTVFFPSCGSMGFTNRLFAMMDILELTGVGYRALGPFDLDICCGYMHLTCGDLEAAERHARRLVAALSRYEPRCVIVGCPWTYRWLRDFAPRFLTYEFTVRHQLQFIADNLERLEFKPQDSTVAYHDSCSIGRWTGEYEAARTILRAMPGIGYTELPRNRSQSACCGNGAPEDLYVQLVNDRLGEARAAGAEVLTATCGGCVLGFTKHASRHNLVATNIVTFISEQLGIQHPDILREAIECADTETVIENTRSNIEESEYELHEMRQLIPRYLFGIRTFGVLEDRLKKRNH